MNLTRFEALKTSLQKRPNILEEIGDDIFKKNVFSNDKLRHYINQNTFKRYNEAISKNTGIDRDLADDIASAMKAWALSKNVTHYTHWFQPLTGRTASKHDSFFDLSGDGDAIFKFDGSQLAQQEPDASSFPNGGIRTTFEARGYTAWDPSSPAFIFNKTLYIPTIFVSYTGEALDYKTPLLRSVSALDKAAKDVYTYFGKDVKRVSATLGWEQEYFLVDRSIASSRPDVTQTGRTLIGQTPPKGQQLDDHYFGTISTRATAFMQELENVAWSLGIPIKTRHNEVAPNQFEFAPIFEEVNISIDHNSLLMEIMPKIASKHSFRVLFHEKPFDNLNGSGKHNNWSMATDTGVNLLSPGKNPMGNLRFLTFFINTIAALLKHESLLLASIASASNDRRLGGNEAPPFIFSVFIGSQLTNVLEKLEKVSKGKLSPEEKTDLKLRIIGKIPEILLDNTDRNRTSPFAFTGNKFEFRAVGSTANCAKPMTVLNTIVSEQLILFKSQVDTLIKEKGLKKDDAIFNILRDSIKNIKNILFEGDGYSNDWVKEADKRGLSNIINCPTALQSYVSKKSIDLFEKMNVMTEGEVRSRYNVDMEEYSKKIQIESRLLGELALSQVIPAAIKYQKQLVDNLKGLKEIYGKDFDKNVVEQKNIVLTISNHVENIHKKVYDMVEARKKVNKIEEEDKNALAYAKEVFPYLDDIRYHCDKLELIVDDSIWPLAKYRELLFYR